MIFPLPSNTFRRVRTRALRSSAAQAGRIGNCQRGEGVSRRTDWREHGKAAPRDNDAGREAGICLWCSLSVSIIAQAVGWYLVVGIWYLPLSFVIPKARSAGRGRDIGCPIPPAQIRTGAR